MEIKCPTCNRYYPAEKTDCPTCNKNQTPKQKGPPQTTQKHPIQKGVIVLGIFILFVFFIYFISSSNTSTKYTSRSMGRDAVMIWKMGIVIALLVPKNTTDEQLELLIYEFREAKRQNSLSKMVPATTPGFKDDHYAQILVFIFSEPEWATLEQNNKYNRSVGRSGSTMAYLNHIRASYEYNFIDSKKEYGSIGYDEGGLRSQYFKELF